MKNITLFDKIVLPTGGCIFIALLISAIAFKFTLLGISAGSFAILTLTLPFLLGGKGDDSQSHSALVAIVIVSAFVFLVSFVIGISEL